MAFFPRSLEGNVLVGGQRAHDTEKTVRSRELNDKRTGGFNANVAERSGYPYPQAPSSKRL